MIKPTHSANHGAKQGKLLDKEPRMVGISRLWAKEQAEREKCAQVTEKFLLLCKCDDERTLVKAIAAAIRVRTKVAALR